MLVRQILLQKPDHAIHSIPPNKTIGEAAQSLAEKRVGALLVASETMPLAGIVSERDIVRELGRRGPACLPERIDGVMTAGVVTCTPADTAVDVLTQMTSGRFRHMPVVEHGEIVGVISIGDVVKARINEVESENTAMAELIAGTA